MKGILEFTLPDEQAEFEQAIDAPKVASAAWNFHLWLRGELKYKDHPKAVRKKLEEVRDIFVADVVNLLEEPE